MSASIAAIGIPIAAAGAFAAKTVGTALGSFGSLLNQANSASKESNTSQTSDTQLVQEKINRFQQQLASRIRNSGVATNSQVEVQLDEFGLLRAYSNGQENTDLSRWLSGEADLVSSFSTLQSTSAGLGDATKLTLRVDLAPSVAS